MEHVDQGRMAAFKLIETGTLVFFDIVERHVEPSADREETLVRVELQMRDHEDGEEPDEDADPDECSAVEWGSFGFMFCLATLSFADARPRGYSEKEYDVASEFTVTDFFECLRYERGELHFSADYVHGRCVKTEVLVRPSGKVTLSTRCRGEAAVRWVDTLKGKKMLHAVEAS